jgi:hypothetical protein
MLIPIGKNQFINPDHIKSVSEGRAGAALFLVGDDDVTTISAEDWQRIKPLIVAAYPAPSQTEDDHLLTRLSHWTETTTLTLAPLTRAHVTESDDEKSARIRLADLWQAKNDAHDDYQTANADDYDACERYAKAAAAYASAACGYIAGLHMRPAALPDSVVAAVTAVEHARAREPFLEPLPALKDLYIACRDALPTPRLMKRED